MNDTAHTILVAFTVQGPTWEQAQRLLMDRLPRPGSAGHEAIDSWWIAEDERYDGSDNDSAVFVPMGKQVACQMEVESDSEEEDE